MMYSLCTSVNSLIHSIILIFALLLFFLNRQTKHTKSFIPPQSKKKKFILRKSVAQ